MISLSCGLMLGFTLAAAVTDIWWHKIFNSTVYPGILVGFLMSVADPQGIGWQDSLAGFGLCAGVMLVTFVMFPSVGGGDLKLVAMMGAFLGLSRGLEGMLWTFVLGAMLGIMQLIWTVGAVQLVRQVAHHLWLTLKYRFVIPLSERERLTLQMPLRLAPAAFLAELIVLASQ